MVAHNDGKASNGGQAAARLLGSTCSGICELMIFHPVDTVAKRLMTNKESVRGPLFQHVKRSYRPQR